MSTFTLRLFLAFISLLLATQTLSKPAQPTIHGGNLDLSDWQSNLNPSITLSGSWFWQAQDQYTPGKFDPAKSTLHTIPVGNYGNSASTMPQSNYWLTITPPANQQVLGLFIHRVCSSARVYLNPVSAEMSPQPLATIGKTGPKGMSSPYAGSRIIPLLFQSQAPHRLLIQTTNHDFWKSGLCAEIKIGNISTLQKEASASIMSVSMPTAMLAMAAIYSIAIYAQRPQNKAPLWLALACCSTVIFFFLYNGLLEVLAGSEAGWLFELRYRIQFISCGLIPVTMMMFYSHSFPGHAKNIWLRVNCQLSILISVFFALTPTAMIWPLVFLPIAYWSLLFLSGLWILCKAIIKRQAYARLMLIAVVPIAFIVPFELLNRSYVGEPPTFSLYALLFFIFIDSQITGRKFSLTFKIAERLTHNLRDEVNLQTAELNQQNHRLEVAQQALTQANSALKELSITDGLTNLYNRIHFQQEFHKEWRRSARKETPISVLMLDADNFKKLNDSAGHKVGDLCLQAVSKQLKHHFKRAGELVARYGGEEFVALLPETDQHKALAIAESLRIAIEKLVIHHKNESYKVTVSIGVSTTVPTMQTTPDNLLEAADAALYEAKAGGRNRVAIVSLLTMQAEDKSQQELL